MAGEFPDWFSIERKVNGWLRKLIIVYVFAEGPATPYQINKEFNELGLVSGLNAVFTPLKRLVSDGILVEVKKSRKGAISKSYLDLPDWFIKALSYEVDLSPEVINGLRGGCSFKKYIEYELMSKLPGDKQKKMWESEYLSEHLIYYLFFSSIESGKFINEAWRAFFSYLIKIMGLKYRLIMDALEKTFGKEEVQKALKEYFSTTKGEQKREE